MLLFSFELYGLVILSSLIDGTASNCPTREWIEKSFNDSHVPGAAIVVINGTQILYEQTFGYHSLSPARFVDAEKSIFAVASISKTLVAAAVMKLVEEERLDLDTDVNQYLSEPNYRIFHPNYTSHVITLRRLLSHSASIAVPEEVQLGLYRLGDGAFEQMTLAQTLFTHVNGNTTSWLPKPPGSVSFYSNDGVSLAGLVVERVAKMPFDQYVKKIILQPLQIDTNRVGIRLADFAKQEELVNHYAYAYNSSQLEIWTQGMPRLNVTPCSVNISLRRRIRHGCSCVSVRMVSRLGCAFHFSASVPIQLAYFVCQLARYQSSSECLSTMGRPFSLLDPLLR